MKTEDDVTIHRQCISKMCAGKEPHYADITGTKFWHADEKAAEKRLTGPELAAEYWMFDQADFDWPKADPDEATPEEWQAYIERRAAAQDALHRFATLPHAAETDYV